jgi:hypothetical protein
VSFYHEQERKRKKIFIISTEKWFLLDVNWGSSTQAQTYKTALTSVHKLINVNEHVKNYRPQILVLSGKPQDRPPLVDLANLITKKNALMVCGHVVQVSWLSSLAVRLQGQIIFEAKGKTLEFHIIHRDQ